MKYPPTPGPWHYRYGAVWTTPDGPEDGGQCIAQRAGHDIPPVTKDANLRLCSAAPDLLMQLKAAENWLNELDYDDGVAGLLADMRVAIAKAEAE